MSIEQLQQDMKNLHSSYKKLVILVIIILLVIILIDIIVIDSLYKHQTEGDKQIQAQTDSMRVHDQQRLVQDKIYQDRITIDSIRYSNLQQQVDNVPTMLAAINHRYDTKRTILNNSTPDEQFGVFSDWISQADSL